MRRHVFQRTLVVMLAAVLCTQCACDRSDAPRSGSSTPQIDPVTLPEQKPQYTFAAGLEEEHPEIVAFMRHFLETCLAGDYAGYRRLVTLSADPESRARFEKILHALRSMAVEQIEQAELPRFDQPVYLVTCQAEFHAGDKTAIRRGRVRRVAIVVLMEDGEWRMGLAPPEYQPHDEQPEPDPAPTSSAPSYPWDQDTDY